MTSFLRFTTLAFILLFQTGHLLAADDKELRKQRLEAQRERQQQVNERNREINAARSDFRSLALELKTDYREQLKSLDTESELRQVDIRADNQALIDNVEAEHQSKIMGLYMNPEAATPGGTPPATAEDLSAATKAYADKIFMLKKQYAEALHGEGMATEKQKNELLTEMDQKVLEEAATLGLTGTYAPILASPIGGELTPQEERWNQRQKKAVAKQEAQNRKLLSEFRNGASLRQWEIDNLDEDFRLTWGEKDKVHALDAEQAIMNSMMTGAAQGGAVDQQQMMQRIQELGAKKRAINTEYRKIRDRNRIERREQRKAILAE